VVLRDLSIPAGVLCSLAVVLAAQEQPTIRTNVPLVLVPVTVTDRKGNFIDGLKLEDFAVTDDGVRRNVRMDTSDTVLAPVSLVVAVQCSGISAAVIAKINRVGGMIQPLITGDRGRTAVIAFDDEVRVFQDFTSDSSKIRVAFEKIEGRVIHSGRMIDAVGQSVSMLETRPENSRRILLLLSESRDRGSKSKLPEAIELAQRAGVTIFPATYSVHATPWTAKPEDNPSMPGGPDYMGGIIELARLGKANTAEAFARATGGRHLSFETFKGLEETITRAGEEIHSQYLLSFVPQDSQNSGFHRINVAVPSHSDIIVRARPGYWPRQN
jgi:VWFA-related protein